MRRELTIAGLTLLVIGLALATVATADPSDEHPGDLDPVAEQRSLAYDHVRYVQTIDGIPVQEGVASHHAPLDGGAGFWTQALADGPVSEQPLLVGVPRAVEIAETRVDVDVPMPDRDPTVGSVWAEDGGKLVRAHEVHIASLSPPALWRVTVDAHDGEVLSVEDRSVHLERPARVFDPNPIVALQDPEFRDNPASLDSETLQQASTTVTIANLTGGPTLATDAFRIVDSATNPQTTDNLSFRREDPRFVEANALAWLQHGNDRLGEVGFDEVLSDTIDVYVHQPPAYVFRTGGVPPVAVIPTTTPGAYSTGGELHFLYRAPSPDGDGMGSAAEDGDVVLHELGHSVLFSINPNLHGPLFGDVQEGFAMAFSMLTQPASVTDTNRACEGEWLTTYFAQSMAKEKQGYPCLRVHDNAKRMANFTTSQYAPYANGEILTGALYDLGQRIGWNDTLSLFVEAAHLFPDEPTSFHELGNATARADCALTDCGRLDEIQTAFDAHGIQAQPPADANTTDNASASELDPASTEDEETLGVPAPGAAVALTTLGLAALAGRRD